MTTLREAAQMALDALETITSKVAPMSYYCSFAVEIESLSAALAQPEKTNQCGEVCERAKLCSVCARGLAQPELEPVAWMCKTGHGTFLRETITEEMANFTHGGKKAWEPLYTAPPQREWQGINDEEIYLETNHIDRGERGWAVKFARAIEAKLKEKNT